MSKSMGPCLTAQSGAHPVIVLLNALFESSLPAVRMNAGFPQNLRTRLLNYELRAGQINTFVFKN